MRTYWTQGIFGVEHPTGSNPTLAAQTRVTGTSFLQVHTHHSIDAHISSLACRPEDWHFDDG